MTSQDVLSFILRNPKVFGTKINERDLRTSGGKTNPIMDTLDGVLASQAFNKLSPYQKAATLTTLLQEGTFGGDKNAKDNPAQITRISIEQSFKPQVKAEIDKKYEGKKMTDELQAKKDKEIDKAMTLKALDLIRSGKRADPEWFVNFMNAGKPETLSISPMSSPSNYGEELKNAYTIYNLGSQLADKNLPPDKRALETMAEAKRRGDKKVNDLEKNLPLMAKQIEAFKELFPPSGVRDTETMSRMPVVNKQQTTTDTGNVAEPKEVFKGQQLFNRF